MEETHGIRSAGWEVARIGSMKKTVAQCVTMLVWRARQVQRTRTLSSLLRLHTTIALDAQCRKCYFILFRQKKREIEFAIPPPMEFVSLVVVRV